MFGGFLKARPVFIFIFHRKLTSLAAEYLALNELIISLYVWNYKASQYLKNNLVKKGGRASKLKI
jgi:hypothetical protein